MTKTNNTLDKILHRLAQYYEAVGRSKASPNKTDFAKAKKEIESLIANREKKMLEFVTPPKEKLLKDKPDMTLMEMQYNWVAKGHNKAVKIIRQRAKEWEERYEK